MIHQLKITPNYFEEVITGRKTFELRVNDRLFKEGDFLALNEWDKNGYYTGRSCIVYVDYILCDAPQLLPEGVVCMAIKPCKIFKTQEGMREFMQSPLNWNEVPVIEHEETEGRNDV